MKLNPPIGRGSHPVAAAHRRNFPLARLCLGCAGLLWPGTVAVQAAEQQTIHASTISVVTNLTPVRHRSRWDTLNLAIGLPLRDRAGLTNLLQQLYDPASTNYHRFLTPTQFAERFGPTEQDYAAVVAFARAQGLAVTARHPNRTLVSVRGTVAEVERALHVNLNEYPHPKEARTFFAPDREPSIKLATPVLAIGGLDNYIIPHPCLRPVGTAKPNLTGSGPGGTYLGNDFRAAYVPGSPLTGAGQTVGLLEFDSGFFPRDITAYETLAGLPNVPVTAVLLDGYNGAPGGGNDEVSLDIEMAISMAPGLKEVLVYEGSTTDDLLNRMATDDLAKQIGASWGYSIDANSEQAFLQFAAQGQSFFNASGDSDAYPGAVMTPSDDPNLTCVGGTTLTTAGPGGAWVSETVWNTGTGYGSSGGISSTYSIPSWQQGVSMTANQGSTTMRNLPDVALTADNVYVLYGNGQAATVGGTSCATPLWAALVALANQLAATNGQPTVGFINPAVYAMGLGSNLLSYASLFHDITTGNNESTQSPTRFSAVPGYDLCTGWGTPAGTNLLTALALPEPLQISPVGTVILTGPVGGPFTLATPALTLTNHGTGAMNWALGITSSLFEVSPASGTLVPGGPAAAITISLAPATTNLAAGDYSATLRITDLTDNVSQTRQIMLAVVTPPAIALQPTNQVLLVGMTANFSVTAATNALMFYRWQENGTNLNDAGQISGSTTSTLTIGNVTAANVGAYSVILSNAAGIVISSNASLTIVSSPPVMVQQPLSQTVLPAAPASFSVTVVGDTPYSYQWQFNGVNLTNGANLTGATSSTLNLASVLDANAGVYSVTVSNFLGSVTSTGALLSLVSASAPGVTVSSLWSFTDGSSAQSPYSPLVQGVDGNFYGTSLQGGFSGYGTIFKFTTNGSLSSLLSFNGNNGAFPYAGLCLGTDHNFYGTAYTGGAYGDGATFRLSPSGRLTMLTTFNGDNGAGPAAGLVLGADGNFYGTANQGGVYGDGTIFRMTPSGILTTLVSFSGPDGAAPSPVLALGNDGNFYGTTENGGAYGEGTIFKMTPAGMLATLYSFTGVNDGGVPVAGVIRATDGNLYGVAYQGGINNSGTVFRLTSAGGFSTLYSFTGGNDGASPWGGLVQASDGNLYGTTQFGGTYGFGTIFQLAPSGSLNTITEFDGYDGANPSAALIQASDGALYGTTAAGGSAGVGNLFRLAISGPLQITGQPTDQAAYLGGAATFTVATSGSSPVSYQWQQDGVNLSDGGNISGSATAILQITNVSLAEAALYSVVVSNAFNTLSSDFAVLQITYSPPKITAQPVSQTIVAGTTATFAVAAVGDQPLVYQWQENGTNLADGGNLSGSAASTLTITGATTANAGNYSVIVSNALFSVTSQKAALSVVSATAPSTALSELRLFSGASDGAFPYAGLIQGQDGFLYGLTEGGGTYYFGSIFRLALAGGLTTLYSFSDGSTGADPYARLIQANNGNFYGTTAQGGNNAYGTVFQMTSNLAVTALYAFTGGNDGESPLTALVQATDGNFYGATYQGGAYALGAIYKLPPNGPATPLYEFTGYFDGAYPLADLVQGTDGKLYGTAAAGGTYGYGTVFSLTTNGLLTTLHSFSYTDGAFPEAGVIQGADGNLYGTTLEGGTSGYGTVFSLSTNGTFTSLISFGNTNGSAPAAALLQGTDGELYGTCNGGGLGGQGTVFRITTNGTLTTLLWFDGLNGAGPDYALVQASDGNFYGTTPWGGTGFNPSAGGGYGTIFRLTVPLFIQSSFSAGSTIACLPYAGTLAGQAVAPAGDSLRYAKVAGPAWLMVAANGMLSGTPTNSDIGTNLFEVSLTDSNGLTATASMSLTVLADPPATFIHNPFSGPWANVGENYAWSIATNGTAPYLGAGDLLTFAKVSGPAWLGVAANGTLSGVPDLTSAGLNTFVVSVTDLGGASNTAVLAIYVNSAPLFSPSNFTKPMATVGVPYSGTIATNAADPDLNMGDTLTFYKVTGAAWLNVATNGLLSGSPATSDVGAENFLLLVVDSGGLAAVGSLTINVTAAPVNLTLSVQSGNLWLIWSGGVPPYQVQNATNPIAAAWHNFGSPTTLTNLLLSPTNAAMFYRVQAQ